MHKIHFKYFDVMEIKKYFVERSFTAAKRFYLRWLRDVEVGFNLSAAHDVMRVLFTL